MFLLGTLFLLAGFVYSTSSVPVTGNSYIVLASDLPALGNRTYDFAQPMFLYVSRHEANQKYDTNIRFIDEKSGVRSTAWAAAQSSNPMGTKKEVFIEGRTSITIHNYNEHVFDDTLFPSVFYFVDASLGSIVYEAPDEIQNKKGMAGENSTMTIMSASMAISLSDFKFPKDSSLRLTAGGVAEVESEQHEIITFDDHVSDVSSWVNLPLPLVTVTSNEMESFQMSVSTKQADRSMAPVGVRTVVMSPGYSFQIPSKDRKYSFKLEKSAKVRVDYVGTMKLETSSLEVVGSDSKGKQTYEQKFDKKGWANRSMNGTFFSAETISVDIRHSIGAPGGILVRIYTTSGSSVLSLSSLIVLSILRLL